MRTAADATARGGPGRAPSTRSFQKSGGDEAVAVEAAEMLPAAEVVEDFPALGSDPFGEGEEGVAFAHVDGAELAGPVVDLAEQVPVNGLEVGEVVAAEVGSLPEEGGFSAGGKAGFGPGELGGVGDAEPVAEDAAAGVEVGSSAGMPPGSG